MAKVNTSPMEYFKNCKLRLSRTSGRLSNWKHDDYEKLPEISFGYDDNDKKFVNNKQELLKFVNDFWNTKNKNDRTYQEQYEFDLRQGVLKLLEKLNDDYENVLKKDIEKSFK